ncbi:hypothetical protein MKX01_019791 [Papaver californicum]|nr:hypothetical protein MKX01_019791 [Papaver californicum]
MHHPSMENASSTLSFSKGLKKGAWTEDEDLLLRKCIEKHGEAKWRQVPPRAGTWSLIAGRVPGRTANDIKNFYNTHLKKTCFSKPNQKKKQKKRGRPPPHRNVDTTVTKVLRPQPRTFSKTSQWIVNKESSTPTTGMMNDNNSHEDHELTTKNALLSTGNHLDGFSQKNVSSGDDYYSNFDGDYWNNDMYLGDDIWRMLGENQDGQYLTI